MNFSVSSDEEANSLSEVRESWALQQRSGRKGFVLLPDNVLQDRKLEGSEVERSTDNPKPHRQKFQR